MPRLVRWIVLAVAVLSLVGWVVPLYLLRCFAVTGHMSIPLELQVVDNESLTPVVGAKACWIPRAIVHSGLMQGTYASREFVRLNGKLTDTEGNALLESRFSGGGQGNRFGSQWAFDVSGSLWIQADGYDALEIPLTNLFGRTAYFTKSIMPLNQVIHLSREQPDGA